MNVQDKDLISSSYPCDLESQMFKEAFEGMLVLQFQAHLITDETLAKKISPPSLFARVNSISNESKFTGI